MAYEDAVYTGTTVLPPGDIMRKRVETAFGKPVSDFQMRFFNHGGRYNSVCEPTITFEDGSKVSERIPSNANLFEWIDAQASA
jgi:hypothetical protein